MFELLEKTFLMGLGALSVSQKKTEEFLWELKEKYKVSEDEGRAFLERLQNLARDSSLNLSEIVSAEVEKRVRNLGLVTRSEYEALERRVAELERRPPQGEEVKVYPV